MEENLTMTEAPSSFLWRQRVENAFAIASCRNGGGGNNVYVVDRRGHVVRVLDPSNGSVTRTIQLSDVGDYFVRTAVVDDTGSVLALWSNECWTGELFRLSDGQRLWSTFAECGILSNPPSLHFHGMAAWMGGRERSYLARSFPKSVLVAVVRVADGKFLHQFVLASQPGLLGLSDVAFSATGNELHVVQYGSTVEAAISTFAVANGCMLRRVAFSQPLQRNMYRFLVVAACYDDEVLLVGNTSSCEVTAVRASDGRVLGNVLSSDSVNRVRTLAVTSTTTLLMGNFVDGTMCAFRLPAKRRWQPDADVHCLFVDREEQDATGSASASFGCVVTTMLVVAARGTTAQLRRLPLELLCCLLGLLAPIVLC